MAVNIHIIKSPDIIPIGSTRPVGEALPDAIQLIVQALNPEKVILFGSFTHGTSTPDSDVDLLIIMESDLSPRERYLAVSRLLRPRPFPVDIIVKTPGEIHHSLETGDFFIKEIMKQGHVLYERHQ